MTQASAYKEPHHVMLFFEEKEITNTQHTCINERISYYENLKKMGKVLLSGNFWNQARNFIIVYVSSDTELEQIIDNDPAIRNNLFELVRAMPF
ncbi:YCII-related domain-containing protein [Mucilaginibacter sp. OK268]|uniref:YciI family protein n=1 Tax=Mucilaginibacter sp. OK268 TaxID=1881048 RepID=UPI00088D31FD|nr:YciI family protein [Mucilaginibacter sp. OK268]SDP48169.1 YCII-related domain-containing protein [Mucilaginibacter sp. OK268]